jgi:hypothetical protein
MERSPFLHLCACNIKWQFCMNVYAGCAVLARCRAESIRIPLAPPYNALRASKLNIEIVAHQRETTGIPAGCRRVCDERVETEEHNMHCCWRNILHLVREAICTNT